VRNRSGTLVAITRKCWYIEDIVTETEKAYRKQLLKLTIKEQYFVQEYLIHGNATRAARAAGYAEKGTQQTAFNLLLNPVIAKTVTLGREAKAERLDVTADKILDELAAVAFATPYAFAPSEDGFGVADAAHPESGAALEVRYRRYTKADGSVETETTYVQQDKLKALEMLGKKLKLFTDKVEVTNSQDEMFRLMLAKWKEEQEVKS
jgi:phage terminase small subunit